MSTINSSIPLSIQYPQSDPAGNFQKGFDIAQKVQQAPIEQRKLEATTQDAQLTAASNKLTAIGNLLNSVKDQNSYSMAKQQLAAAGIIQPQDIPDQYDPAFVDMHKNSLLNAKSQLDKQYKMFLMNGGTQAVYTRLLSDPDFKENYLTQKNASKGMVVNPITGNMETAPGYNAAIASTKGAEKAAEQQAILDSAGDIEKEKTIGAATGKSEGEIGKRAINAPNNLMLIKEAETLLPQATSGLASHIGRGIANMAGVSTDASKADRQLQVLSAAMTAGVPRMEGPQSDKDVAMYKQAAGDVGNPDVPYQDRLAALDTIKALQLKYQEAVPTEKVMVSSEPINAKAVNAAQVGKLSLKDPRVKAALAAGYTPDEIAEHLMRGR